MRIIRIIKMTSLFLCSFLLFSYGIVFAQGPKSPEEIQAIIQKYEEINRSQINDKKTATKKANSPPTSAKNKFPPKYLADNKLIIGLFNECDKIEIKGEYETTKAHNKRIKSYSFKKYTFSTRVKGKYNPDKKILTVEIPFSMDLVELEKPEIETSYDIPKYGRNVTKITNIYEVDYGIKITNKKQVHEKISKEYFVDFSTYEKVNIKMPTDYAKKYDKKINLLLKCKPYLAPKIYRSTYHSPFIDRSFIKYSEATINDPTSKTLLDREVWVKVYEIWLFNFETGEILKHWKI
ncbi:hypothetical protein ACFLZQ_04755 [Thermodesulfobacteriota bacterium]